MEEGQARAEVLGRRPPKVIGTNHTGEAMTRPQKTPRCGNHDETMHLLAGGGYVCLSCERGDPGTYEPRPMSSEFATDAEFEEAITDWRKRNYPSRKGSDF